MINSRFSGSLCLWQVTVSETSTLAFLLVQLLSEILREASSLQA